MGISPATVAALRADGHEVVTLAEGGLHRLPDPDVLDRAREERRVLLTHDLDFGELVAASGARLPSVVIFRLADMRPASLTAHVRAVLAGHAGALDRGAVVSVSERQARVRLLPIG